MARLEFASDYMEGCIPEILTRLTETNLEKSSGYGSDEHTARAAELIREACDAPDAEVHLLAGGTQTNRTVIGAMLKPWEGVIAAQTGHISVHEAGAIESLGHKVFELPQRDGKLRARDVEAAFHKYIVDGNRDHMPAPALVYISHPTETGTLYTRAELEAVTGVAHRYGARVFLDGARLAYGLGATKTDLTLADIARTCDAFYIGGTKCGALFGEAVVFPTPNICPRFFTWMKQQGALLAKGRITGLQFETLMEENRYVEYGAKAVRLAEKLREGLKEKGYQLLFNSTTNQTFVKLSDDKYQTLSEKVGLSFWESPTTTTRSCALPPAGPRPKRTSTRSSPCSKVTTPPSRTPAGPAPAGVLLSPDPCGLYMDQHENESLDMDPTGAYTSCKGGRPSSE